MSLIRSVVFVASIFLGLSAAFAQQPATTAAQVIYACKNNYTGDLKVVAQGTACPRNWTLLRTPRTLTESRCPVLRRSDSGSWIPVGDEAA
jgi:hypothetical protein